MRSPPFGSYDTEPDQSFDLSTTAGLGQIMLATSCLQGKKAYYNMSAIRLVDIDSRVILDRKTDDAVALKWPPHKNKRCQMTASGHEFTVEQIELGQRECIVSAKINTLDFSTVDIKVLIYADASELAPNAKFE